MTHLESVMGDKTTIRQSEIRGVYLGAACNHISRSSLMRKMELVTFITVTFCSIRNVWSTFHNFMEIFHGNKMIKRNDFPVSTKKFNDQYYYNQMVVLHLFAFSFSIRYELYPLEGFSFVCNSILLNYPQVSRRRCWWLVCTRQSAKPFSLMEISLWLRLNEGCLGVLM